MAAGRLKKPLPAPTLDEGPAEFIPVCARRRQTESRYGTPARRRLPGGVRVAAIFRR